jgi:hypothetical protein
VYIVLGYHSPGGSSYTNLNDELVWGKIKIGIHNGKPSGVQQL